ncbi:cellulose biosynthesis protein BcsQ [Pseudomonas fragi]|uniref:cellulose biosynthesis protein BcsQ n=1 Tax=Pseudomonas fragi TaxID=296 RepID=UPI0013300CDA|nr:cellulose biosynthesis protein BcsQ [Pseudomonas fragi]MBM1198907.1 cellulose synthase operon protein YhjQ [Pseudomonas fragi]NNA84428.1 cellulose synthase operon protein YhjQ [Pseudomonas fragi]NNB09934.1 cellulose synthase operon protein YhjQ [Pseudomonas fragi]NNB37628.1 cellulose synthase operon protein YhjQ [Pseudomonas fragi]WRT59309.1 cellulose biosynthesis protein BcsQ [Pseudomonas fragi]
MSRTDDISNLFSRFGATSDSYHEFDSQFDYPNTPPAQVKSPLPAQATAPVPVGLPLVAPAQEVLVQPEVQAPLMSSADVATPLRNLLAEVALARQAETQSLQAQLRTPQCKARVVVLVSAKGGVGKTTLAASLASSVRLEGGKTLAIDLDPQNALHHHLGIASGVTGMGSTHWSSHLQQGFNDVQVLPYGVLSDEQHCALEREMSQDRHWLARQLERMALGTHDLVIVDTPSGRSAYLQQALDVADQVLVVTAADAASFIALEHMDRLLGADVARSYVVNRFEPDREFSRDMLQVLKRRLGAQLMAVVVQDHSFGEALAYGHNPLAAPAGSAGGEGVLQLGEQLKTVLQGTRAAGISAP